MMNLCEAILITLSFYKISMSNPGTSLFFCRRSPQVPMTSSGWIQLQALRTLIPYLQQIQQAQLTVILDQQISTAVIIMSYIS